MRTAVLGTGSIGGFIGGSLAATGAPMTLIGRPRVIAEIEAHGMTVTDMFGRDERVQPQDLRLSDDPTALADAALILVTVKSKDTAAAAAQVAQHASKGALVLSLQNGVSNAEILRSACPDQLVLAGMVPFNVVSLGKGRWHRGTEGDLWVADHGRLIDWLDLFATAKLPLRRSSNMPGVQWGKLLVNLNNACNALAGVPLARQLADRDHRCVVAACIAEGLAVTRTAGIVTEKVLKVHPKHLPLLMRMPNFLYQRLVGRITRLDPHARSSMWEDLQQGRQTEIDALQGEILRWGTKLGVPTPVNAKLVELIKAAEDGGKRNFTGAQLRAAVSA
jgi:2-dehydropantoate 2-reductase